MAPLLEKLSFFSTLGIRCWDPVGDRPVADHLEVVAWPDGREQARRSGVRTPSGVFAFADLPGLHPFQYLDEQEPAASPASAGRPFTVEVNDRQGRFLPIRFGVTLPLPYAGVYRPAGLASPEAPGEARVYLFSAPSRQVTAATAALRACLVNRAAAAPAAYAIVELHEEEGKIHYGLADERGCCALLFPYPPFRQRLGASPPGIPLQEQSWSFTLKIRHDPALFPALEPGDPPTLTAVCNQPYVPIWRQPAGPAELEPPVTLTFGQALVLKPEPDSTLAVGAPASSP